jgi:hypothetical protein
MKPLDIPIAPDVSTDVTSETKQHPERSLDDTIVRYDTQTKQWFSHDEELLVFCTARMPIIKQVEEEQ